MILVIWFSLSSEEETNDIEDDQITILSVGDAEDDVDDLVSILSLSELEFSDNDEDGFNTSVIQVGFGGEHASNLNIISIYKREYTKLSASGLRLF